MFVCMFFRCALLSWAFALVSKHNLRGLQEAGFCFAHRTVVRVTLKWMVKWSTVGCKRGSLCQKTLPKGMSTWSADLFFKERWTFKPHRVISRWPKNPCETQMKGTKEIHIDLPAFSLHLCHSYHSFPLFCFDMCPGSLCVLKKLGYPGKQ